MAQLTRLSELTLRGYAPHSGLFEGQDRQVTFISASRHAQCVQRTSMAITIKICMSCIGPAAT